MNMRRALRCAAGLAVVGCATAGCSTVGLTYRESYYVDNYTTRDSHVRYQPEDLQDVVDELNLFLRGALGPTANASIRESHGAMNGDQAVYRLSGGTLNLGWSGPDSGGGQTLLSLTGLVGDADVRSDFAVHSIMDVDLGPIHVEDTWVTNQQIDSNLRRLDAEAMLQHNVSENFALLAGLRYERVKMKYSGWLQTTNSRNLENLFSMLLTSGPLALDLTEQDGIIEGGVTYDLYSARLGVQSNIAHGNSRLFFSVLLHYDETRPTSMFAQLTPTDPNTPTISRELQLDRSSSAGIDLGVGYAYEFIPRRASVDVRYRAIAFYPTSGSTPWDDPRVNHGLYGGLTVWFGR